MMIKALFMVLAINAVASEVPDRPVAKKPTMLVIRVEGDPLKRDFLIPIELAKDYHLKPGQLISLQAARLLARELGAVYTDEMMRRLEELGD